MVKISRERYRELMNSETLELTPEEIADGWHFCYDWDFLLVHPSHPEASGCCCHKPNSVFYIQPKE